MKIYYTGNLCRDERFNDIVKKSKSKPSAAGLVFENMLLSGFRGIDDLQIDVRTYINQASFPNGKDLFVLPKTELLECGYKAKIIPTVNINGLKQFFFKFFGFFDAFFWMRKNRGVDACYLTYSVYGFMNSWALFWAKHYKIPTCAIVPDLPCNHFEIRHVSGIKKFFSDSFLKDSLKCQEKFDAYVLLTEQMKEKINACRDNYIVVEGICTPGVFPTLTGDTEKKEKAVMYAGMLCKKHRTDMLVDSFMRVKGEYKLWLFGSGDAEEYIKECAKKDDRIVYFGRVPRETVLEYELRASLLVNVRDTAEQYTRYSFPSKTMEYMSSGTPLLTTRLSGIPREYFDHVYTLEDETTEGLAKVLCDILALPQAELSKKGRGAKQFVADNKNLHVQARKIYDFLKELQS